MAPLPQWIPPPSHPQVFDHIADPWELTNLAGGNNQRGNTVAASSLPFGVSLGKCSGDDCNTLVASKVPKTPLPCKTVGAKEEGWWGV